MQWESRIAQVECPDATFKRSGILLKSGQGSILKAHDGREFIDLCAGFGVLALGHRHPDIIAVLGDDGIMHGMGDVYATEEKIELLELLRAQLPASYGKGALAVTGSQAVEYALKTAYLKTQKRGVLAVAHGYHGLDMGVLPLSDRLDFTTPFQSALDKSATAHIPYGATEAMIAQAIASLPDLCAIVVEPLQGRGGVIGPDLNFLQRLSQAAQKHKALLIFDEIFCGGGRLGFFTFAKDVAADVLCFGKAISGGMPLSAVFAKDSVFDAWPDNQGEAIHTGTFFGHPLSCRVALASMKRIRKDRLMERAIELGDEARHYLGEACKGAEVRGMGLMLAIDTKKPQGGVKLWRLLEQRGVIAIPSSPQGESLTLSPAWNIQKELWREALLRIKQAWQDCDV